MAGHVAWLLAVALLTAGCRRPSPWELGAVTWDRTLGPAALPEAPLPSHLIIAPREAPAAAYSLEAQGPLELSIEQAVYSALAHNRSLSVEQLGPVIAGTFEELERAVFDPALFAELTLRRDEVQQTSAATATSFSVQGQDNAAEVGLSQFLPTGTTIDLSLSHARGYSNRTPDQHTVRAGVTVTQALLRGAGLQANLARIRQAELATLASEYELRGFAEALVAEVEDTYWQLVLAQREIQIFENSLALAGEQQANAQRRVEVGALAETELAAVRAEVARRQQDLIDARSNLATLRLRLLQQINPPSREGWERMVIASSNPALPDLTLEEVQRHVDLGLRFRPELHEARLRLEQDRLQLAQTRRGLLPRLDLFVTLGKSGFAGAFGQAVDEIDGPGYDFAAGLRLDYPLGNRAAEALHTQALVTRVQAARALQNLAQLIELDVRTAYLEVRRAHEQLNASAATRALQEEVLRAETAKFEVGRSTAILVAQAQRDLLFSQIAEVEAVVAYRQALIALYRLEGTLLTRRGIAAPGAARTDPMPEP